MVRHQPKRTRAGVGVTGERPKLSAPTGRVCVVGDDTRVADGVPLGLGSWAPNRGTLVQLAVGNFQSFEPGLDRSRLKVVPRVLVVRGLVSLILSPGRFRERSQGPRADRAPCSIPRRNRLARFHHQCFRLRPTSQQRRDHSRDNLVARRPDLQTVVLRDVGSEVREQILPAQVEVTGARVSNRV